MKLLTRAIAIVLLYAACAFLARAVVGPFESVKLAWDRHLSHGTNITFALKWGAVSNTFPNSIDLGTNTTTVFTNLTTGFLYFVVVARTTDGLESDPSNVVAITNYPAQPIRLRMVTNMLQTVRLEGTRNGGTDWQHLADVTNEPAVILGGMRSMMLRAATLKPPLP